MTPEQNRRAREAYYGSVECLDDCLAGLMWRLGRAGALENTIVVYLSDHGDLIGNHGLWWKANYYAEAIRWRIDADRQRMLRECRSGVKPTTPNQYRLPDGRIFDAEGEL